MHQKKLRLYIGEISIVQNNPAQKEFLVTNKESVGVIFPFYTLSFTNYICSVR